MALPFRLLSLPEEIIEHVCRQLVGHPLSSLEPTASNTASLSSLCQTSKKFNQIATPVLYSRFKSPSRGTGCANFLRSISLRPELGEYVQELIFPLGHICYLTYDHFAAFDDAAARLGVLLNDWMDGPPYQAIIQLIIAQTPRVRSIDVAVDRYGFEASEGVLSLLEEMAAQVPRRVRLLHLRKLSVRSEESREVCLEYFGGIIKLAPYILSIIINPCAGLYRDSQRVNNRISLSNVTSLFFDGGHLSQAALESLVGICGQLVFFQYMYTSSWNRPALSVTPREVIEILMPHKNSLRFIHLDLGWRERHYTAVMEGSGICDDGDQIISVRDFSQLEVFEVDGTSVLFPEAHMPGYHTDILKNMLPRSIRCFYLHYAQKESAANMVTVADSIHDFPFLGDVVLSSNFPYGPLGEDEVIFDKSEIESITEKLKSAGVNFSINSSKTTD